MRKKRKNEVTKRQILKAYEIAREYHDCFSISLLQRKLGVKMDVAWEIADIMESKGKIGRMEIGKCRTVNV